MHTISIIILYIKYNIYACVYKQDIRLIYEMYTIDNLHVMENKK